MDKTIVKICKHHGELEEKDTYLSGKQKWRLCKICRNWSQRKFRASHKEYVSKYRKKRYLNNKQDYIKRSSEYYYNNKEKRLNYSRLYLKKAKIELNDVYIKKLLRGNKFPKYFVTENIIEIKKLIYLLKRKGF